MKKNILVSCVLLLSLCFTPRVSPAQLAADVNSLISLKDLELMITTAQLNILMWRNTPGEKGFKARSKILIDQDYPKLKGKIEELSKLWNNDQKVEVKKIFSMIDSLFTLHKGIMDQLNTIDQYEKPEVLFPIESELEDGGEVNTLSLKIKNKLENSYKELELNVTNDLEKTGESIH